MSNCATQNETSPGPARVVRGRLANLLPAHTRLFLRRCAELDARARRVFVLRTIRRLAGRDRAAGRVAGYHHVVFVCHGNILRSAFAAALLMRELQAKLCDFIIESAGLHARPERPADPRGVVAAESMGIDLRPHSAAPLTAELVRSADLLVIMDFENEAECIARFPEAATKLRFLGAFDRSGPRATIEVPDPYTLDDAAVAQCYDDVARCVLGLQAELLDEAIPERR